MGVGGKGRTGVGVLRRWCEKGVSSPIRVVNLEMGRHKCCQERKKNSDSGYHTEVWSRCQL